MLPCHQALVHVKRSGECFTVRFKFTHHLSINVSCECGQHQPVRSMCMQNRSLDLFGHAQGRKFANVNLRRKKAMDFVAGLPTIILVVLEPRFDGVADFA